MKSEGPVVIALPRELSGREIVNGLAQIGRAHGLDFAFTPVTTAYANVESSEQRTYRNLTLRQDESSMRILPPMGTLFEAETHYSEVRVELSGEPSEALEMLRLSFGHDIVRGLDLSAGSPAAELPSEEVEYSAPPPRDYSVEFRVLAITQGEYGRRILENLRRHAPEHWRVSGLELRDDLPSIIDEPTAFVPDEVPETDLILFLSQSARSPQLIPEFVRRSRARALIAPVDNGEWMPLGQARQAKRILDKWGVESAFPRPFCELTETGQQAIDEFARLFGRPSVEIVTEDHKTVKRVIVRRGSPCGATWFVADAMAGQRLDETVEKAALAHHHYPCLASMTVEQDLGDTLMHASGFITKREFEEQVKKHLKRKVGYIDPRQFR